MHLDTVTEKNNKMAHFPKHQCQICPGFINSLLVTAQVFWTAETSWWLLTEIHQEKRDAAAFSCFLVCLFFLRWNASLKYNAQTLDLLFPQMNTSVSDSAFFFLVIDYKRSSSIHPCDVVLYSHTHTHSPDHDYWHDNKCFIWKNASSEIACCKNILSLASFFSSSNTRAWRRSTCYKGKVLHKRWISGKSTSIGFDFWV